MTLHFVFFIPNVYPDKITYQSILEWNLVSHVRPAWWWSSTVNTLDKEQNSRTRLQIVTLENQPWNSLFESVLLGTVRFSSWVCAGLMLPVCSSSLRLQEKLTLVSSAQYSPQFRLGRASENPLYSTSWPSPCRNYLSNSVHNRAMQGQVKARAECMVFCSTWSHFSHAEVCW